MIKTKDLIVGEVYIQETPGRRYICKYGDGNKDKYIMIKENDQGNEYYSSGTSHNSESLEIVGLATPIEIKWLELCIAANDMVPQPKEEIVNEYPIY